MGKIGLMKWEVYPNLCPNDFGFGYCIEKNNNKNDKKER